MASLRKEDGRNGYRISWYGVDRSGTKRKRSIWLGMKLLSGRKPEAQARRILDHVEHLIGVQGSRGRIDKTTSEWLASIGAELRQKLIKADLIEPSPDDRGPVTLKAFLDDYCASRRDVKPSTQLTYQKTVRALLEYFGADRRLVSITAGDAESWRVWLATESNCRDSDRTDLADNTVRRRTGIARQFFRHAIKRKMITENPFAGLAAAVHGNSKRQHFVPAEIIIKALKHARCPQLRAVIALSRFGGLRCPSEVLALTWQDVDLEAGRLTVRAPKTEHHEDGGLRFCPIFPELRPYLVALYDITNPGLDCPMSTPVITRWQDAGQNLRTPFLKLLTRASIEAWPRLFHNMRATRQTELLADFPLPDVCDWLGNSQAVAMKHYAMATSDSFQRAIRGSTGGSIPANQQPSGDVTEKEEPSKTSVSEGPRHFVTSCLVGDEGLEPPTSSV